jgi:hypothetical protein
VSRSPCLHCVRFLALIRLRSCAVFLPLVFIYIYIYIYIGAERNGGYGGQLRDALTDLCVCVRTYVYMYTYMYVYIYIYYNVCVGAERGGGHGGQLRDALRRLGRRGHGGVVPPLMERLSVVGDAT